MIGVHNSLAFGFRYWLFFLLLLFPMQGLIAENLLYEFGP